MHAAISQYRYTVHIYNAKMILRFWALHPHLEDDWLWTCADWDADCLIESHGNNDTVIIPLIFLVN